MRKVPTAMLRGTPNKAERDRLYNRHRRDRDAAAFYHSPAWLGVRQIKLCQDPWCEDHLQRGEYVPATTCHHRIERSERPDLELDIDNLISNCSSCHTIEHNRRRGDRPA